MSARDVFFVQSRHMVTAPNGELLLAYSGINKVGRVRIR